MEVVQRRRQPGAATGGPDSMTMAVAHRLEGDGELQPIVLDLVREVRPPLQFRLAGC